MGRKEVREQQRAAAKTQKKIMDERRLRMAYVRGDILLNWFKNGITAPQTGFITFVEGIPDDVLLLGVDYSLEMGGFKFLLGSLEFEPVPEGEYPQPLPISIRQFDNEADNSQS